MPIVPDHHQLDIFADARDVMLRNDLVDALARRDLRASHACIDCLGAEYPADALLAPARSLAAVLAGAGEPLDATAGAGTPGTADRYLREHVLPAAVTVLGAVQGRAWLVPLWRELALQRASLPWNGARPDDHATPLWLAAGDWARAAESAGSIASWRRIPDPLTWMTEARYRLIGLDETWPLLTELAWLSPRRLDALLVALADPLLNRLRRRFDQDFDAGGHATDPHGALAWFPAWVLTHTPALGPHVSPAEPGQDSLPERALRLLVQLLGLEHQGRHNDLMSRRKSLRDLSSPLYEAYMATR
jgi:hypothetical protein